MGFEEYTTPVISDNEITVSKISSERVLGDHRHIAHMARCIVL